mmetsp:Transcript_33634/g.95108  ORF Transcript_33634/g.95108 Transcript_33634/m.95108 type:complete len:269 (-) Transcript_33634:1635-2441(-)
MGAAPHEAKESLSSGEEVVHEAATREQCLPASVVKVVWAALPTLGGELEVLKYSLEHLGLLLEVGIHRQPVEALLPEGIPVEGKLNIFELGVQQVFGHEHRQRICPRFGDGPLAEHELRLCHTHQQLEELAPHQPVATVGPRLVRIDGSEVRIKVLSPDTVHLLIHKLELCQEGVHVGTRELEQVAIRAGTTAVGVEVREAPVVRLDALLDLEQQRFLSCQREVLHEELIERVAQVAGTPVHVKRLGNALRRVNKALHVAVLLARPEH